MMLNISASSKQLFRQLELPKEFFDGPAGHAKNLPVVDKVSEPSVKRQADSEKTKKKMALMNDAMVVYRLNRDNGTTVKTDMPEKACKWDFNTALGETIKEHYADEYVELVEVTNVVNRRPLNSLKGKKLMSDYDILVNYMGHSKEDAEIIIQKMKIQKLEDLKLQILAQNPSGILGVETPPKPNVVIGPQDLA